MEHEFYECPEYLSNTPAEVERTEEYEYEVQLFILSPQTRTWRAVRLPRGLDVFAKKYIHIHRCLDMAPFIALSLFVPSSAGVYQKFSGVKNEER